MSGNLLVRFDEGRVGRTSGVALSPTLPFMLNGAVYVAGLIAGGGWRGLLPRRTDLFDALRMFRYYIGFPLARLARRQWAHPSSKTKYNALQRAAYFTGMALILDITSSCANSLP
jgi:thiosulfate reductase cytochrome b subunit